MIESIKLSLEYPNVLAHVCPVAFKHQALCERVSRCREKLTPVQTALVYSIAVGLVVTAISGCLYTAKLTAIYFTVIVLPITILYCVRRLALEEEELQAFHEATTMGKEIEDKIRELSTIVKNFTTDKIVQWIESCRFFHGYRALRAAQSKSLSSFCDQVTPEYLAFRSKHLPIILSKICIKAPFLKTSEDVQATSLIKGELSRLLPQIISVFDDLRKSEVPSYKIMPSLINYDDMADLVKANCYSYVSIDDRRTHIQRKEAKRKGI